MASITIGKQTYEVRYTSNALRLLEKETGRQTQQIGLMLMAGRYGFGLLQEILWAGLEGARIKLSSRPAPYTVNEVGDLIDEAGGPGEFWDEHGSNASAILDAWMEAFPAKKREEDKRKKNPPRAAATK
jgi:hypothetical protein